jgi:hypothetical protein
MGFYADTMHMARLWDTARDKTVKGEEGTREQCGEKGWEGWKEKYGWGGM